MMYQDKFVVSVKHDGNILREDKDLITLPFGSEYSLFFKNLNSSRAVVNVEIDGKDVLSGHRLIVNANDTLELERFLENVNSGNRLKFIQKTGEIQAHRGDRVDDGIIRISFQFESTPKPIYHNPTVWYSGVGSHPNYNLSNDVYSVSNYTENTISSKSLTSTNVGDATTTRGVTMDSFSAPNLEEGITVAGSKSNQMFREGYVGALDPEKHVMIIRLQGAVGERYVEQPITVKTRLKCETCGRQAKSSAKFCPNCGTALEKF